jgi:uncharacterized protein (TIGR03437 family)
MRVIRTATAGVLAITVVIAAALPTHAQAQTAPQWTPVAGYTVNLGLAGPATGPVQAVWYTAGGNRLLALTQSGRVFETTDFQRWQLNSSDAVPPAPASPPAVARPEAGFQIGTTGVRRYSLTRDNVYGTDDAESNRVWVNLTGFNGVSIIGGGFSALAVSPSNPLDITAANQFGVWRSLDGGLSWQSLNTDLPNLDARSFVGQRTVVLADSVLASVTAGKWTAAEGVAPETALRAALAARTGIVPATAVQSGSLIYAGMMAGGLVRVSADEGSTWRDSVIPSAGSSSAGSIDRLWVDPANPQAALAVSGAHLFRTTNAGAFWDDVTGTLSAGAIHGITADSSAGVVYAATDTGIFSGRLSLNAADRVPAKWISVTGDLPIATAWDARLNMDGTLTVLLDGYGAFEAPAPHRAQAPRIVNAADMTDRAAAPGSLISVLGASVRQATSGQNAYPVLIASEQSSQLQVPFEVKPGLLQLAVQGASGSWVAPLNVKEAAPAIFVDADGAPMLQDAASQLVIDAGTPLQPGARVQVLATGLGKVTPEWPTNTPAPVDSPPSVVAPVTAFLDGTPIQVISATLAPTLIGNYLVELQIPAFVNRGASELRIVVNGEESNRVKLYLEPGITVR